MDFLRRLLGFQRQHNYSLTGEEEEGIDLVLYLGNKLVEQPSASEIQGFIRHIQNRTNRHLLEWMPTQCRLVFQDQIMTLRDRRSSKIITNYRLSNIVVSCVYAKDQKILAIFYHNEDIKNSARRNTGLECHVFQCGSKLHARTLAEKISTSIMSSYLQRQKEIKVENDSQTLAKYVTYDNIEEEYMPSDKLKKKQLSKSRIHRSLRGTSKGSTASTDTSFERVVDKNYDQAYSTDTTLDSNVTANKCYLTISPLATDECYSESSFGCEETESSRAFRTRQRYEENKTKFQSYCHVEKTRPSDTKQRLQCERLRHWRSIADDHELSDSSTSTSNFERTARIKIDIKESPRRDSIEADISTVEDSAVEDAVVHSNALEQNKKSKNESLNNLSLKDNGNTKYNRGTTIKRESKSEKQRRRRNRDSNRSKSFTASETLNHIPIQTLSWYGQRGVANFDFSDSESIKSYNSSRDKANDYVRLIRQGDSSNPLAHSGVPSIVRVAPSDEIDDNDPYDKNSKSTSCHSIVLSNDASTEIGLESKQQETEACTTDDKDGKVAIDRLSDEMVASTSAKEDLLLDTEESRTFPDRKSTVIHTSDALQVLGELNLDKAHLRKLRTLSETNI